MKETLWPQFSGVSKWWDGNDCKSDSGSIAIDSGEIDPSEKMFNSTFTATNAWVDRDMFINMFANWTPNTDSKRVIIN